ncbi:CCR4-NOT transcription complex subunit 10 [Brachypodium distachyon]|uniref:CCR4-NOT transcription complex subunit 10 n=1 Tax=Brachypodium distachyon TaxID=15368 RepID=A0A0Q3I659_BRADI|nr:CCR4-NOT transcription complex subunit 10 [Brachypodium distachyon]KQJ96027.1 hypothetical protein BRADI_3g20510v3 [Brachypodium distachyon]|eukprot:XP_003571631.1 CCR4-NOT transcription complex subunit 10 [Brachypodium distachyon]
MDPPPPPPAAAAGTAKETKEPLPPPQAEEDGLMSLTAAMAREAAVHFQSRRYGECVEVLRQIWSKKSGDPKVLHNMAITESFLDGCSDPNKLLEILDKAKKGSEDLASTSREKAESLNGVGINASSGSRGNTIPPQTSGATNAMTAYGDEFDTTIITFNTAAVLYYLHDYSLALSVLEPLYKNIEPIDETTALRVCFLLLDIALALQDATKAAEIIQYLEKSFGVANMTSQNDNASVAQLKVPAKGSTAPDVCSADPNALPTGCENLVGNLSDDTLEFETLYSTLDSGNQNLSRSILNDFSRISADLAATAADLKVRLQIYKVRLLLLTRNLKVAKRELKVLMNMARGRDSSTELLLKSQLEYARGNYRKAVKLLSTQNNRTEPAMLAMFYNNLGCILHQQKSNHTSVWFFSKSLRYSLSLRSEKPLKLPAISQDKSCLISYNCGIQHLMCGKPLLAARCFHEAIPLFYNQSLFWLRFAECGLFALEKGLLSSSSVCIDEIDLHVVGSGKWRHLVVNPVNSRVEDIMSGNGMSAAGNKSFLSLRFVRQCLLNAQLLLGYSEQNNQVFMSDTEDPSEAKGQGLKSAQANANGDQKGMTGFNITLQNSIASYEEICRKENLEIKQAVLADLAFVELCLENPSRALSVAKLLQQLPDCSRMYVFLSRVYCAEALCVLKRPDEAAEELSVYMTDVNNFEVPFVIENFEKGGLVDKDSDCEDSVAPAAMKPIPEAQHSVCHKPEEALGVLYIDQGMLSAMQGDIERATYLVDRGFALLPNDARATLAAVYLDLVQGKTQEALPKLRQCKNVRFRGDSVAVSS